MAIACDNKEDIEHIVQEVDVVLRRWCLEVSADKTEVMTVDRFDRSGQPQVHIQGQTLKNVDNFKYLGTYFTSKPTGRVLKEKKPTAKTRQNADAKAKAKKRAKKKPVNNKHKRDEQKERERTMQNKTFSTTNIEHRIAKANSAFYAYAAPIYRRRDIRVCHKLKIFKMTAIPTLLYGSEIWSPTRDEISRLESWQNRCMKYMLGIFYRKHGNVSGAKLRQKCRLHKIEKLLRIRRLRWFDEWKR